MEELCFVRHPCCLIGDATLLYIEVIDNGSTAFSSIYEEELHQMQQTNNSDKFPLIPFAIIFALHPLRLGGLSKDTAAGVSKTLL
jgi:hypothetical protein